MRSFAVATTCNEDGWREYGRRMVETFLKHWPEQVRLHLYPEGFEAQFRDDPCCVLPEWLEEFKRRHLKNPAAHGRAGSRYDFRRDCVKFAHKVAAVTDAALKTDADVLIWMDADTVTHAPVTVEWLESLFNSEAYIAWLDRLGCHPESGFYMLNTRHPQHEAIVTQLRDVYTSDLVFQMRETNDAFVLQQVIEKAIASGTISAHSLSGPKARKYGHVFANSQVSERLDHMKGNRKKGGRTPPSERIALKDANPYWRV